MTDNKGYKFFKGQILKSEYYPNHIVIRNDGVFVTPKNKKTARILRFFYLVNLY